MGRDASGKLRIVVLGYLVRGPIGGMAWSDLHYVLGLRDLGHEVWFVEDSDDYPGCFDPTTNQTGTDPSFGLRYAADVLSYAGIGDRWAYHDAHTGRWLGPLADTALEICADADVVLNLGGVNPIRPWLQAAEHRIFVDKDPVFTQLRISSDEWASSRAADHTKFFTFAANVGEAHTSLPADGVDWQPTRHPIWLPGWPSATSPPDRPFTTVMQWESYPAVVRGGARYGVKADSFATFVVLPTRVDAELELAVSGPAPRTTLAERGWKIRDPAEVAADPWTYRRYIQASRGEFSVAKHAYLTGRSGWFSERSASYLASCRPVATQETGFSDWLPSGEGVLSFSTLDEAATAIGDIEARYASHCRAARELAEEYFDSNRVLADLLDRALEPVAA